MLPTSVVVAAIQCLLLVSTSVTVSGQDENILSNFKDYLNGLPNQPYVYEDALLLNKQDSGSNVQIIEVNFKVSEKSNPKSFKLLKCTATIASDDAGGIRLPEGHHCQEDLAVARYNVTDSVDGQEPTAEEASTEVIHEILVELDNEVQSDTAVTSGEQFVAVPRQSPEAPCIGCSSFVNTSAAGVSDLALQGVADLNRHVTNATHTLNKVLLVERQVQVNGVRYIMKLDVDYIDTNQESGNKICKISILEKPWVKRFDGSKYRAVLSNNCTEEWIYDVNNDTNDEDNIKAIHTVEAQAAPSTQRTLTDEEIKLLEDQIIPNIEEKNHEDVHSTTETKPSATEKVQNVFPVDSSPDLYNKEETSENQESVLTKEKQEVIDGLMNFFDNVVDLNLEKNQLRRQTTQNVDAADKNINSEDKVRQERANNDDSQNIDDCGDGCPNLADPRNPEFRVMAEKSLKKYTEETGLGSGYSVISVDQVTVQVVGGFLTRLNFTIDAENQHPVKCKSDVLVPMPENTEHITVTCDWINIKNRTIPDGDKVRQERAINDDSQNIDDCGDGCPNLADPRNPEFRVMAEKSLKKYTEETGLGSGYSVISVDQVTVQVVGGFLTRLNFTIGAENQHPVKCKSDVLVPMPENTENFTVTCDWINIKKREIPDGDKVSYPIPGES